MSAVIQSTGGRGLVLCWLLRVVFTAAIVLGVVSMHSGVDSATAQPSTANAPTAIAHHIADVAPPAEPSPIDCAGCTAPGDHMAAAATCFIALLMIGLWVARPLSRGLLSLSLWRHVGTRLPELSRMLVAPSLHQLSISRT